MCNYELLCGDANNLLAQLSGPFDSLISDIPYGITDGKAKTQGIYAGDVWPDFGFAWDKEMPLSWLPLATTLLKDGAAAVVFCDNQKVTLLWNAMEQAGLRPLRVLYWHKTNPPTNPRKNFCSSVETAVFARKPGKVLHWGGGGATHNFFQCAKVAGVHKVHPTQKPLALMEWIVGLVTPPGGHVLDPFCGGGTTGVAALKLGMSFTGIDNDPNAVAAARQRLDILQ